MRGLMAVTVVAGMLVSAGLARGADINGGDQPPIPHWDGFYAGASAGWASVDRATSSPYYDPFTLQNIIMYSRSSTSGWIGGGFVGLNYQAGNWVFGIDADITGGAVENSSGGPWGGTSKEVFSSLGATRVRAGYAIGNVLIYTAGGFAFATYDDRSDEPDFNGHRRLSGTITGWTIGGGLDVDLGHSVFARFDLRYFDLGKEHFPEVSSGSVTWPEITTEFTGHAATAGIGVKF